MKTFINLNSKKIFLGVVAIVGLAFALCFVGGTNAFAGDSESPILRAPKIATVEGTSASNGSDYVTKFKGNFGVETYRPGPLYIFEKYRYKPVYSPLACGPFKSDDGSPAAVRNVQMMFEVDTDGHVGGPNYNLADWEEEGIFRIKYKVDSNQFLDDATTAKFYVTWIFDGGADGKYEIKFSVKNRTSVFGTQEIKICGNDDGLVESNSIDCYGEKGDYVTTRSFEGKKGVELISVKKWFEDRYNGISEWRKCEGDAVRVPIDGCPNLCKADCKSKETLVNALWENQFYSGELITSDFGESYPRITARELNFTIDKAVAFD